MNDQGNIPISKNMLTSLSFAWMLVDVGKTDPVHTWIYVIAATVLVAGYMFKDWAKHKNDAK